MKKILSFILGSIFALNLSISVANSAAAEFATEIERLRANIDPRIKLSIFFIYSPMLI